MREREGGSELILTLLDELKGGTYLIFPLVKLILGPPFLIIIARSLTLENRKFRLENQMVRSFPFGNLQKIWAVICRDAIFLLLSVCSADFDILRSGSNFCPGRDPEEAS